MKKRMRMIGRGMPMSQSKPPFNMSVSQVISCLYNELDCKQFPESLSFAELVDGWLPAPCAA
jgi:hypothetical protein